MGKKLEGKSIVITGSGRGIGRTLAVLAAAEGAKVVVNDPGVAMDGSGSDQAPADEVVEAIRKAGGTAVANYDSVASVQGGEGIIQTCVDAFGRIDCLINVAGILRDRMVFNMSEQEWDAVIAVHLKGHFACSKPAAVLMRQQRYGRIINFTSISGLRGNVGQANYGAAKAGIAGFTRVLARDLGRYGVTCNAIAPIANTRMTQSVPQQRSAAPGSAVTAESMEMRPEQVAPMVLFLATDDAWNINGQIFHVSGGMVSLAHPETPVATITKDGKWTLAELAKLVPEFLMEGITNPSPPPDDLELPGRPAKAPA